MTSKHHKHEETRNIHLHLMQSDLYAKLHRTLSNYEDDGLFGLFKDDLGYLADNSHMVAYERYQHNREWTWRCSNNRARFLELQAYEYFAQGLLILSTHLDHAELQQLRNSGTRWFTNPARTAAIFWNAGRRTRNVGLPPCTSSSSATTHADRRVRNNHDTSTTSSHTHSRICGDSHTRAGPLATPKRAQQ